MRLVLAAALLALGFGAAQPTAVTLAGALEAASLRPEVVNAEQELAGARRALERAGADPLALRMDRLQASQRLELAEARLELARVEARKEITDAYLQLLESEAQRRLAQDALALSEQALEITRIRVEVGSAPEIELSEAQTSLKEAAGSLQAAVEAEALARDNLEGLLEREFDELAPAPPPQSALPAFNELKAALAGHPTIMEVRHGASVAELAVELLDPSYAPRVEIDQAQLQRDQALRMLAEVERGLRLQVQALHLQATQAVDNLEVAQDALRDAEARLDIERRRFDAGLSAEISLRRAELDAASARLEAMVAAHEVLRSRDALAVAAAHDLESRE